MLPHGALGPRRPRALAVSGARAALGTPQCTDGARPFRVTCRAPPLATARRGVNLGCAGYHPHGPGEVAPSEVPEVGVRALRRSQERSLREPAWIARLQDLEARIEPVLERSADESDSEVLLDETARGLTLTVRGALDARAMPALATQFDLLQCTPCEEAVLDLCDVTVVDCVGLNAVAGLSHYVAGRGGILRIRCRPGAIRGLLVSTGLGARLEDAEPAVRRELAQPA